jgi:hypothetical protein
MSQRLNKRTLRRYLTNAKKGKFPLTFLPGDYRVTYIQLGVAICILQGCTDLFSVGLIYELWREQPGRK